MDPISSVNSGRSAPASNPIPAQQRQDEEALNALQRPSNSFGTTAPGQDVQLQRRQVVEDANQNQKVTDATADAQDTARLSQYGQALSAEAPAPAREDTPPNPEAAEQLASQVQQSFREQPENAIAGQANISRQTALTLFQ